MVVHLIDGTYELFRHFYGRRRRGRADGQPFGAAAGVLHTVLQMIETGATHVGVATDHVIESFRNDLWPGYKTGAGVDPALRAPVRPARGRARGDGRRRLADGRARGRRRARRGRARSRARTTRSRRSASGRRTRISRSASAATASCRSTAGATRSANADGVREKFGVEPARIPDLLALVGDCADGYPGHRRASARYGARGSSNRYGRDRGVPARGARRASASSRCCSRTSRRCARRRRCSPTSTSCAGAARRPAFAAGAERLGDPRLVERSQAVARQL